MNSLTNRLFAVAAIIAGAWVVNIWVGSATVPNDVEFPNWSVKDLPYELGDWHGEDVKMDPMITAATGAEVIVERSYQLESKQPIALHTAMFKNPGDGVYHSPLNCYAANGWKKVDESVENVQVADDLKAAVNLVTWEKDGERVLVAYWYQLGRYVLHDRFDLGKIRLRMRGQAAWPALIKVMAQIPASESPDARKTLVEFARVMGKWLNQPSHQEYLSKWRGV